MILSRLLLSGYLALTALILPAPARAIDLSGEVGVVSDYRDRGVSLSEGRPALQASLGASHSSGVYGWLWASTLERTFDPSAAEVDATLGFAQELTTGFGIDLAATYVAYPASGDYNYFELAATATRSFALGDASVGLLYAPAQNGLRGEDGRRHDNVYTFATVRREMAQTPFSLIAAIGYERGAFDLVEEGAKWDWRLGIEAALGRAVAGLAYSASTADGDNDGGIAASLLMRW